ncbi:hypothetical protein EON63_12720, partial [archaeon]
MCTCVCILAYTRIFAQFFINAHTHTTLTFLCMYVYVHSYKLGDLQASDDELQKAFYLSESSHLYDLQALALINRCVILIKKDVLSVAITIGKQALDILLLHHVCEKDSYQYRQYVYVLVLVYVKTREFSKAEVLVE